MLRLTSTIIPCGAAALREKSCSNGVTRAAHSLESSEESFTLETRCMASDSAAESSGTLLISKAFLSVKAKQGRTRSKAPRAANAMAYNMHGMTLGCRSSSQSYVLAVGHLGKARPSAGLTRKKRFSTSFERSYSRLVSNVAQSQQQSTDGGKRRQKREVKVKFLNKALYLQR